MRIYESVGTNLKGLTQSISSNVIIIKDLLLNGGGGNIPYDTINAISANVSIIKSEVYGLTSNMLALTSNLDYLNTITSINEAGFLKNKRHIELIKLIDTYIIPTSVSSTQGNYDDALMSESMGGLCIIENKYNRTKKTNTIIDTYFNLCNRDTLFTGDSLGTLHVTMIVSSMIKKGVQWENSGITKTFSLDTTVSDILNGIDTTGILPGLMNVKIIDFLQGRTGLSQQSQLYNVFDLDDSNYLMNQYTTWIIRNYTDVISTIDSAHSTLYHEVADLCNYISNNRGIELFMAGLYGDPNFPSLPDPSDTTKGQQAISAVNNYMLNNDMPWSISIDAWIYYLSSITTYSYFLNLLRLLNNRFIESSENPIELLFDYKSQRVIVNDTYKQSCGINRPYSSHDIFSYIVLIWLVQIVICKAVRDEVQPEFNTTSNNYSAVGSLYNLYSDMQLDEHGNPGNQGTCDILRDNTINYFRRNILLPSGVGRRNKNCILQAGPNGLIFSRFNKSTLHDITSLGSLVISELQAMGWNGQNASSITSGNCQNTSVLDGYHLYNVVTLCNSESPGNTTYNSNVHSTFNDFDYYTATSVSTPLEQNVPPEFMSMSNNVPIWSNGLFVPSKYSVSLVNNNTYSNVVTNSSNFSNRVTNPTFQARVLSTLDEGNQLIHMDLQSNLCMSMLSFSLSSCSPLFLNENYSSVHFEPVDSTTIEDLGLYADSPYNHMSDTSEVYSRAAIRDYMYYLCALISPDVLTYCTGFNKEFILGKVSSTHDIYSLRTYIEENSGDTGIRSFPDSIMSRMNMHRITYPPLSGVSPPTSTHHYGTLRNYFEEELYPIIKYTCTTFT
jgi:hypothetical protein